MREDLLTKFKNLMKKSLPKKKIISSSCTS